MSTAERRKCKAWTEKRHRSVGEVLYPCQSWAVTGALYCRAHKPGRFALPRHLQAHGCAHYELAHTPDGATFRQQCPALLMHDQGPYCAAHALLHVEQLPLLTP